MVSRNKKPTFIDMFCGCGGMSAGFKDAGFDLLFGIDHDKASLDTFNHNFGQGKGIAIDLFSRDHLKQIQKHLNFNQTSIDVVVAGPPCQGFSLTGPRNFDDPRNQLYLSVIGVVKKFRPKAFLIENVKGMKTMYGGSIMNEIVDRFSKIGYRVCNPTILLAADYGVPQMRERLFIVGIRNDFGEFNFPEKTHQPTNYVTCEEAIGDLPCRNESQGNEVDNYISAPITEYQKFIRDGA